MKNIILILCSFFAFSLTFIGFNSIKIKKLSKIEDIKNFSFTYSQGYAMNSYTRYNIQQDKESNTYTATVKPYGIAEEDAKTFKLSKDKIKELEDILNKYNVSKWNGFNKSDSGVLDGDSFSLSIAMENGESIRASGYMMWPENYRNVRDELKVLFDNIFNSN